jgi:hypothetical protein
MNEEKLENRFKVIKKTEAPNPTRAVKKKYLQLYNTLKNMSTDDALLIEFKDENEATRISGTILSYFCKGAFTIRRVSKTKLQYIVKHVTEDNNG